MKNKEKLLQGFHKVILSRDILYVEFLLAAVTLILQWQIVGGVLLMTFTALVLIVSDDLMPTLFPFLLVCIEFATLYDSYDLFMGIWWLGLPFVAAVIFHFIYYRKKITYGRMLYGLIAVSAALIAGGIGMIPVKQYVSGIALYYTLGLGVGMAAVYLLLRSQYQVERDYDMMEYVAYAMYLSGFFAAFVVLYQYSARMDLFLQTFEALELPSRNNYATFLMFAMPFPFYFALQKKEHVLSALFFYGCIVLTGSRGGLLCGGAELFLCFCYLAYVDDADREFDIGMICGLLVLGIMCHPLVLGFYASRCDDGDFFNDLGGRIPMAKRAFSYLRQNPLFGSGIGYLGNTDIYTPKKGALCWYHSLPFQIIGSMGIAGVLAYGYLIVSRIRMMLGAVRHKEPLALAFFVTYLGILLMSCFNPGEFCPVPYEFLIVLFFVLMELDKEKKERRENVNASS